MNIKPSDILDEQVRDWYRKRYIPSIGVNSSSDKAICIHCIYNPAYLQMACLCVSSLRKNGIDLPIIIMTDEALKDREEWAIMASLGTTVFKTNCTIRQWCYEIVFRHFESLQTLINIDCDQYAHNYTIDFDALISSEYELQLFEKNNWENEFALEVFRSREFLFYNGPRDLYHLFKDREFKLTEYEEWCQNRRWVWGNFCIINRSILKTNFWKITKQMGFIYPDDEGAYMIAQYLSPVKHRFLNHIMNQYIGSLSIIEEKKSTLVHYPGPNWKKESLYFFEKLWRTHFANKVEISL
jgi:hypothetical protein